MPESNEVRLEPMTGKVRRWNASARRAEDLDHVVEQLVCAVELLVEGLDLIVEPAEGGAVELFEELSESGRAPDDLLPESSRFEGLDPREKT
jgi:hypothetical protein